MIHSFKSSELERFYRANDSEKLPFFEPTLTQIVEVLTDLNSDKFLFEDFSKLWTVYSHQQLNLTVLTVNGVESCGAIIFEYEKHIVFNVDYFAEV